MRFGREDDWETVTIKDTLSLENGGEQNGE